MRLRNAPIRLRLTMVYAACMVVVLAGVSAFVFKRTGSDLTHAVDAGIRSRAEVLAADVTSVGPRLAEVNVTLIENDEAFAQVADAQGRVVQSSDHVAGIALLAPTTVSSLSEPTFFNRRIAGLDGTTRILAVPVRA